MNSASPNQVRSLAVSRSGNNILLRWSVATDNGKGFRIYFRPKDGGTTVLLTPQGLASTARSYTVSSQALASGCLEFFLRQFTVQGETADGPHTDLGTPLAGSDGRANDPCQPGGGSGSNAPSGYTFLEHFQMRDHLGSLRVVSDETGAVEEKLDFYPFGQEISFGTLGDESERKYTGHQRDGRTGLDYMMARFKAPWMGSFQSPDPIDDVSLDVPWSWNKYAYVRGNPVLFFDPTGLATPRLLPPDCSDISSTGDVECTLVNFQGGIRDSYGNTVGAAPGGVEPHGETIGSSKFGNYVCTLSWQEQPGGPEILVMTCREEGGGNSNGAARGVIEGSTDLVFDDSIPCSLLECTASCFGYLVAGAVVGQVGGTLGGQTLPKSLIGAPVLGDASRTFSPVTYLLGKTDWGRTQVGRVADWGTKSVSVSNAAVWGRRVAFVSNRAGALGAIALGGAAGNCTYMCQNKLECTSVLGRYRPKS